MSLVRRQLRSSLALAACLGLICVEAAPAGAQSQRLFNDFKGDGNINTCNYSAEELARARGGLPPDIEQYAPGLVDQLNNPCVRGGGAVPQPAAEDTPAAPAAPAAAPVRRRRARVPDPPSVRRTRETLSGVASPRPATAPSGSDAPAWLVALLALVAAGGLAAVAAHQRGVDLAGFGRPARASLAEGGDRVADAFWSLVDRLRSPR